MLLRPVQLKSDFKDNYDFMFDQYGEVFERNAHGGMPRSEALAYLSKLGFLVPDHGTVADLAASYRPDTPVVVYTDELAHGGEGKRLCSLNEATKTHLDAYASLYLSPSTCPIHINTDEHHASWTFRYLQVGYMKFWLEYWSDRDWRSNVGAGGSVIMRRETDGYHRKIDLPLWAIDFIVDDKKRFWAVDFNSAPSLNFTGIVSQLGASAVANAIGEAVYRNVERQADAIADVLEDPPRLLQLITT